MAFFRRIVIFRQRTPPPTPSIVVRPKPSGPSPVDPRGKTWMLIGLVILGLVVIAVLNKSGSEPKAENQPTATTPVPEFAKRVK